MLPGSGEDGGEEQGRSKREILPEVGNTTYSVI